MLLTITGDPVLHHVERQPEGGDWERIASILGETYRDGPLDDGPYHYCAVAQDEEGAAARPCSPGTPSSCRTARTWRLSP